MKKVFSIVVTYNGMQWIEKCLDSLENSSYPNTIIVIDNYSTDGTAEFIEQRHSSVQILKSASNLGFGRANNIGISVALQNHCDYVFLLNQDAWVEPETIAELLEFQCTHPDYGILSPLHLNGKGDQLDSFFLRYFQQSSIGTLLNTILLKNDQFPVVTDTQFVNAAAWLITRDCLDIVGGFDPIFFHYGEDLNYCQRALYKKIGIGIHHDTRIFHAREHRTVSAEMELRGQLEREWVYLLTVLCDIRNTQYRIMLIKSLIRHMSSWCWNMLRLNRAGANFHYSMARNIIVYSGKIKNSRQTASSAVPFVYLDSPNALG